MNDKQKERFEQRLAEYDKTTEITPGVRSLIYTLACVEVEEETLQEFINRKGTTYVVMGTAGDPLSKIRPEWNQLKEARMRKQALIARIELKGKSVSSDELDEFLNE